MSRNGDPRTARTRSALGAALMELITERPFESITVQDVLDRAHVGRSTFYVHYDGKNDLFASDVDRFWTWFADFIAKGSSDRVVPLRELLDHVDEAGDFPRALRAAGKHAAVLASGRIHIANAIEQRLSRSPRARDIPRNHLRAIALAHAGGVLALVEWWPDRDRDISAAEVDELFERMFWKSIDAQAPARTV